MTIFAVTCNKQIPCSTDLLHKLLCPQPVTVNPALHGIRIFITVFKTANQLTYPKPK